MNLKLAKKCHRILNPNAYHKYLNNKTTFNKANAVA